MNKVVHADKSMHMSLRCRRLAVMTCAASVLLVPLVASAEATKFIASGWEFHQADADTLLARADEMDATPIDGCMLPFWAKDKNGGKITSRYILQQPKWDYSDLESVIPSYRKLLSRKAYRSSFLTVFGFHGMKKRVAWTDDETWGRVAHNMRLAAR